MVSKDAPTLERVLPKNYLRSLALAFPLDWSVKRPYRMPSNGIGPYYIDWQPGAVTYGEDWTSAPKDADDVILTRQGAQYHPVRIAQFGLYSHARFLETRDRVAHHDFMAQARWLAEHQRYRDGVAGCYVYEFPNPHYGVGPGWLSAMAQGEAISLLLRAAAVERSEGFADAAAAAAQPFRVSVQEGGVVFRSAHGDVFLEEIAGIPSSHILNGHIFALWGLLELQSLRPQAWLGELIAEATATLRKRLALYDAGYWSYYSLLGTPGGFRHATVLKYHAFHISQLRVTAALVGDPYFAGVADRWQAYADSPACRAHVLANTVAGLVPRFVTGSDSVNHGAVDLLDALVRRTKGAR
jgi:heparosan-N-sulfate-glucuronate 5-epimerase